MKKLKRILVSLIMALCFVSPAFAGCSFLPDNSNTTKTALQARTVTLFEQSKCISWDFIDTSSDEDYADDYASAFDIYCNNKLVDTVANTTHIYEFENLLTDIKNYDFTVVAKTNKKGIADSPASNSVTYNNTSIINRIGNVKNINLKASQITASISSNLVIINASNITENVSNYLLYLKSNSTGLNVYTIDVPENNSKTFTFVLDSTKYNILNEIYTIRIGYTSNGVNRVSSDIVYYNPDSYTGYTDNIFTFDGFVVPIKTFILHTFLSSNS